MRFGTRFNPSRWFAALSAAAGSYCNTTTDQLIRALPNRGRHMRADALRIIADTVAKAEPRLYLELGSGSSTVFLAHLCKTIGRNARVVSIEENLKFAERTRSLLQLYKLLDQVSIIVSPVIPTQIGGWRGYCYDISQASLASVMAGEEADLVLIDGPMSAWTNRGDCRYGTLPLIRQWLTNHAIVIIDDAHRRRERRIIERWTAEGIFQPVYSYSSLGWGLTVGRSL